MRGAGLLLTGALLLGAGVARAAEPLLELEKSQQELFLKVAPAVVFVSNGEGFGSGFFVTADGLFLTNAHVVGKAETVNVVLHDGRRLSGRVVERAANDVDLALVQVPVKGVPVLPLESLSTVRIGSWVGAVSHGRGAIWTFNTGMISNIYPDGAERPVFQTQIPLNPGSSGGPIFDRLGRVVGIITAGIESSNSINFGIGVDVARRSLAKLASLCDCLVIHAPGEVPIFVDGVMVGTGPRAVHPVSARKTYEVFSVIGGQMKKAQVKFPEEREVTLR